MIFATYGRVGDLKKWECHQECFSVLSIVLEIIDEWV